MPLLVKRIVPPAPRSPSPTRASGWKCSTCRRAGSPSRWKRSPIASSSPAGPHRNVSRSRQSAHSSSSCSAVTRPCSPRAPLVQAVAGVARVQRAQLVAEDHAVRGARAVHVHDVAQRVLAGQPAQHAHDRRDAAAGADEQQSPRQRLGQHERSFHAAQAHDRPGAHAGEQERRDLAVLDELRRDRDAAVACGADPRSASRRASGGCRRPRCPGAGTARGGGPATPSPA